MGGLEGQLGGMGTAFGSSLLGLAGSLVVGLLELFASHAQNRFYRELEEWLSSITKLGVAGVDADEPLTAGALLAVIEQTATQIDQLREVVEAGAARASQSEERIEELARLLVSPERLADGARADGAAGRLAGAGGRDARRARRRDRAARRRDPRAAALDRHPGAAHPRGHGRRAAGPRSARCARTSRA